MCDFILKISDWRQPFNLQKGWLLWAGVGLVGALIAIALTGVAISFFSGENQQREVRFSFFLTNVFNVLYVS